MITDEACLGTCGVASLSIDLHRASVITLHDKTTVISLFSSEVRPSRG